ncbi:hypothetical protein V8G54_009679 [Vigna mungo]|uniref:Integrase zinc-binding domain-containing protein n=1 Tax=Vigna mungo TaxID=3915 RepID=A0AAQ3S445_VIGMU
MMPYYFNTTTCPSILDNFDKVKLEHISRGDNIRNEEDGTLQVAVTTGVIVTVHEKMDECMQKASYYTLTGDNLFRKDYSRPLLQCLTLDQVGDIICELHEGICRYHFGARTMFWLTTKVDCVEYVKKCIPCQKHDNMIHDKQKELHHLALTTSPNGNYANIVYRYGVLHAIIIEYGNQLIDKSLTKFYVNLDIKHITSSIEHPQSNGQAEVGNKSSTKETPFSLVYDTNTAIPIKIREPSPLQSQFKEKQNENYLNISLDSLLRTFKKGDLMWRMTNNARKSEDKFSANWEGPSKELTRVFVKVTLPNTWNLLVNNVLTVTNEEHWYLKSYCSSFGDVNDEELKTLYEEVLKCQYVQIKSCEKEKFVLSVSKVEAILFNFSKISKIVGHNQVYAEGASINRPPLFTGDNYALWKVRMEFFMGSIDRGI